MSRQYDDSCLSFPPEMPMDNYVIGYSGETYAKIPDEPKYYVSNEGKVISFVGREPREINTWTNQYGHRYFKIHGRHYSVHRLVAELFLQNKNGCKVVRHLNDDPNDNRAENLAWGTQKDNADDCRNHGRMYMRKVYCLEKDRVYDSCLDASIDIGVSKSLITLCCKGKNSSAKGYHLCYLEDLDKKRSSEEWTRERTCNKKTVAISPTGDRMIFSSRKEAAETLGIPGSGISNVLRGFIKTTHGWRFEEG